MSGALRMQRRTWRPICCMDDAGASGVLQLGLIWIGAWRLGGEGA